MSILVAWLDPSVIFPQGYIFLRGPGESEFKDSDLKHPPNKFRTHHLISSHGLNVL